MPAENTPAGRKPGIFSAPRERSRQPMAKMTAPASTVNRPSSRLTAVTTFSGEMLSTIAPSLYGICKAFARSSKRAAYSGPVSSSLNVCRPKPLWMHWFKMPPRRPSLSKIKMSSAGSPFSAAATAAASPAGPPPMMTSDFVILFSIINLISSSRTRFRSLFRSFGWLSAAS